MSVYLEKRSGRWAAQVSHKRKKTHLGTFDTEAEARAAEQAAKPPPRQLYVVEDRGYDTPCWTWQGGKTSKGYGGVRREGRSHSAHRWIYEQIKGPITDGMDLDHLCRQRDCVNPDHLEPVTNAENLRRGKRTRLTAADVEEIRASSASHVALSARYSVCVDHIYKIRNHQRWA